MAVVLITGCSSGFGKLAATELAASGHNVVATMRGVNGKNSAAADELRSHSMIRVVELDVTSDRSVNRSVEQILADSLLDVVIHNAGIGVNGVAEGSTPEQFTHIIDVNLIGVHRLNRAILPHLRARNAGLLIYVSSGLGRTVLPYLSSYCASKFALEAYAESLAYEVTTHGIDTVILQPGAYPSNFRANILDPDDPSRLAEYPIEQAEALASHQETRNYLASDAAPDPREVTNAMLSVIDMPAGERPFRIAMRKNSGGLKMINQICGEVQGAFFARHETGAPPSETTPIVKKDLILKLHELPSGRRIPNEIFVVVEVPYGHRNKYEYDSELGAIVLDRPLFSPVHYPGDYGFIPGTMADDGDPLDVLVMVKTPTFPGCVVAARPLGVLLMHDEKGGDEKILAVPCTDPSFETYHSLSDVPPHFLREMDHFFRVYKELEGKHVTSMGWKDRWEAEQVIKDCIKRAKGGKTAAKKKVAAKKSVKKSVKKSKRGAK